MATKSLVLLLQVSLIGAILLTARNVYSEDTPDSFPPADSLRVASFNIRYQNTHDGENHWQNRRDAVAAFFRFHRVDVAGLQEALLSQIDDLESRLPEFAWIGVGRNNGKDDGEFTPILYRKSKCEPIQTGHFWLSETPEVAGSVGWDSAMTRLVTWAQFRQLDNRQEFTIFNTHFDHVGKNARAESAKLLRKKCKQISKAVPFLVTGDFNCQKDSEPYRILTAPATGPDDRILVDAHFASKTPHYGPLSTWNGFQEIVPDAKIDFIFASPKVTIWQHGVLTDRIESRFLSDHLPVVCDVTIGQ